MTFSLKVAFSFLQLKIGASCKSINLCWMSIFFFSISSFTYCWCILYLHLYLMLMLFVSIPVLDVGRILGKAVCCPWDVCLHHRLDHLWGDYVPFQNIFFCYFLAFFAFLNTINVLMCVLWIWVGKLLDGRTKSSSNIFWKLIYLWLADLTRLPVKSKAMW